MTDRPIVVITDYDYGNIAIERQILEAAGAEVVALQAKTEEDLLAVAKDCSAIMNQYARVGAQTIEAMERCQVIARYGVGVDIVDVDAATRKGILVTNVQNYCTEEVADHAIAMWLSLTRKLNEYNRATHEGIWRWQSGAPVHRIRNRVMGVVSLGKIGQEIAKRAQAFGATVIAYDPFIDPTVANDLGIEIVAKPELLRRSHYLLMQAPMTPDTYHFLSAEAFEQMQDGVLIINTGRGPTIDNAALYAALVSGKVMGAALDDPEEEPAKKATWSPEHNPLFTLPNVIVTPHSAYYSEESIAAARTIAATQVAKVLTGQPPDYPVNHQALSASALKKYQL